MKVLPVIIFATALAHAADAPITQDELVRRTQELYDAIVPGDQAPWKKYFADFVGIYELAPDQTRSVTAEGGNLFVERKGKREQLNKKEQLFPETSDLFFRKGVEGRILFRYDARGKVDALIDRRNNEDVVWTKKR